MIRGCIRFTSVLTLTLGLACGDDSGDSSGTQSGSSTGITPTSTTDTQTMTTASTTDTPTSTSTGSTGETGSTTTGASPNTVTLETSLGTIILELDPVLAPITTENFLTYVDDGFYDGQDGLGETTFHRVAVDFVIQGGGVTAQGVTKATHPPIVNEFGNGLLNVRGTISMARTSDPDSATSQFFINLVDNANLDIPPGYAVFGAVTQGMDVVDAIAGVPLNGEMPVEPILIVSATAG